MKGRGLLHEPFSRSDLLRVLERERVRETPTGPDPSPSGWPLCKRVLNRPCERLFNWAAWRWQSALHLWVDLYPVTKSRRGTSCTWTLIPLGRWEIYLYTFFNIRNCCCWKPFFLRDVFKICMNDSWSQTVARGLLPSAVEIYKTTEYKSFISVLFIYLCKLPI